VAITSNRPRVASSLEQPQHALDLDVVEVRGRLVGKDDH